MTRFLKVNSSSTNKNFKTPFLDDNLVYEKEFISLYISGISEKVKLISQFLFGIF